MVNRGMVRRPRGESAGSHFPAAPLTPLSAAASPQDRESDTAGGGGGALGRP